MEETCSCCERKKEREAKEYKDLLNRLNRIEGQVRGIKGMLEQNAYCVDILTQVAATTAALNGFSRLLLENHIRSCVVTDLKNGKEDTIEELMKTIQKFMR